MLRRRSRFATPALAVMFSVLALTSAQTLRPSAAADIRLETLRPESGSARDWRAFYLAPGGAAPASTAGHGYSSEATGEWTSGVYMPLSQRLGSVLETTNQTTGSGANEWSVLGQIGTRLGFGWGVQAGVRHSEIALGASDWQPYRSATAAANLGIFTFERHWDRYRGAYTLIGGQADTGAFASAHRWQIDWFYSESSSVGLAYTAGTQLELSRSFATLAPVPVSNLGVVGEHWLTSAWAIRYRALLEDRGGFDGLQPEIQFGIRSRF